MTPLYPVAISVRNCEASGLSREKFLAEAPKMPGARKVGRNWVVPTSGFLAWLAAQDAPKDGLLAELGYEETG